MVIARPRGQTLLFYRIYRRVPPGVPTTLHRKLVAFTDGEVNPTTLIWNGRIRKALVMPAWRKK